MKVKKATVVNLARVAGPCLAILIGALLAVRSTGLSSAWIGLGALLVIAAVEIGLRPVALRRPRPRLVENLPGTRRFKLRRNRARAA